MKKELWNDLDNKEHMIKLGETDFRHPIVYSLLGDMCVHMYVSELVF